MRGGEVIELVSDLGGGKTTFTRGLSRGAGSSDRVASPTFTISREYDAKSFVITHFDFYRLPEAGIMAAELAELIGNPAYVVVVEWGEAVHDVLPKERLSVQISLDPDDENGRFIDCRYPKKYAYLLEDVR